MKVGCCGWGYIKREKNLSQLQTYAKKFNLVEVNSTFYRLPKISTAEKWYEEAKKVNSEFEFTIKVNKVITHEKFFKDCWNIWEKNLEVARALKAKIILFQTPKSFKPTTNNIKFVNEFFKNLTDEFIYVIEFRGWPQKDRQRLVEKFGVVDCRDVFKEDPIEGEILYTRLHGKVMYKYKFTKEDLIWLKNYLEKRKEKEKYILFNNVYMYENALEFKNLVTENEDYK